MKTSELLDVKLDFWTAEALQIPLAYFSSDWAQGGPLLESNQIFLDPPHDMHVHGGSRAGWHTEKEWNATVSARVRVYWRADDDREGLMKRGRVGRGKGPTPLIAAMRAIVCSVYGEEVPDA